MPSAKTLWVAPADAPADRVITSATLQSDGANDFIELHFLGDNVANFAAPLGTGERALREMGLRPRQTSLPPTPASGAQP